MKIYRVYVEKNGLFGRVKAENEEGLHKKLSTGLYGVMGVHARNGITFTPENVVEIIEEIDEPNTSTPNAS